MVRILKKNAAPTCLVLFAALMFFCFLGTPSRAAADRDDIQIVVTTYRDGRVYETSATIDRANFSSASTEQAVPPGNQTAAAGDIVISQIYSNGGNSGSTYQNNYLELFNRTDNAIDFDGWRIYATSANGTFDQAISFVSSRGIYIGGHQYLLIRFGPVSSNGATVPADLEGPTVAPSPPPGFPPIPLFNLSPSGKVFITPPGVDAFGNTCPPNSQIVDFVGHGVTASCFEGSGPTGTTSNTTAALRKSAGCTDSDNNASDFDVSAPSPRNSAAPQNFCGTPPLAVIQFNQATFFVTENSGSIGLFVTRSVNWSGVSTVDYATSDTSGANNCNVIGNSASSRCDYIQSTGTLQFAAGETFKLINIPLIDDNYGENTENFSVSLSNPTAATLGTLAVATVAISDNGNSSGNPIDQTAFFVREHYVDFLGREPDIAGSNYWIGDIDNCSPKPECTEIKRINVSASFFLSIEFQETGYLAYRAYKTAYGDATGQAIVQNVPTQISVPIIRLNEFLYDSHFIGQGVVVGTPNWPQQLESNKVAYFASFVSRQRFLADYPANMTAAEFVNRLNERAGNVLSPSERDTLTSQLQFGQKTRAEVFRAIAENDNLKRNESNRAFVLMQYFGYLRRNPNDPQDTDYSGYKFWLDKLNQFNGNFIEAQMVKAFLDSLEYRQRFAL
jgi:hypothetical protein